MSFTVRDVLRKVVAISKAEPDFIYTKQEGRSAVNTCSYTGIDIGSTEGSPCIVGRALMELGVPQNDLLGLANSAEIVVPKFAKVTSADWWFLGDLENIQYRQDNGETWRDAVTNTLGDREKGI